MAKFVKAIDWYVHVTMLVSIVLIVVSFFLPPRGAVEPSAMAAAGELGAMAAVFTFMAKLPDYIKAGTTAKITKGNTSIEITSDNNNKTTDNEEE
jgi:hypothetical protein